MPKVALIMGSLSDKAVIYECVNELKKFSIECEVRVISAHRSPEQVMQFAKGARANGVECIIAAAGKAAHLPGVIAGHTVLPVIGLPVKSSFMDGLDSLLSIVQMPAGVPVATVGVNNGTNAALLAAQILMAKHDYIYDIMTARRAEMAAQASIDTRIAQDEINDM